MFRSRGMLTALLLVVLAAAWLSSAFDRSQGGRALSPDVEFQVAMLMHDLGHPAAVEAIGSPDPIVRLATYCYTFAYFILFPALCVGVAVALAKRKDVAGYRVLCLAVVIDYLLTSVVSLFMPSPSQWGSNRWAEVLAGLWSPVFLQLFRPIRALDTGFPFSHVSLIVIAILVCSVYQVSLRLAVLTLGLAVMIATFFMGVYWVPFIAVGMALGWVSVLLAQSVPAAAFGDSPEPIQ